MTEVFKQQREACVVHLDLRSSRICKVPMVSLLWDWLSVMLWEELSTPKKSLKGRLSESSQANECSFAEANICT